MEFVSLGSIVDIYLGITHTPEYVNEGIPFLSVKDISKGKIDFSNCKYISIDEYNSFPKGAKPQNGDILFCRVGTIGKPIIIPDDVPCFGSFVSLGFLRLKSNEWNPKFIKYWMESDLFWKQVKQNTKGASQVNLNTNWLKKFIIPNYSIEIQNKIVDKLDKITNLIILNNLNMDNLENIVKSQFIEMFGSYKKDTPIANVTSEIKRGQWGDEPLLDELNYKVIKTNNMEYDGTLDLSEVVVRNIKKEKFEKNKLEYGDILVEKCGGTKTHSVGYSCLFLGNDDFVANNFIMILTPNKEKINPYFLQYQLRYMYESNDFADCFNKTTGIQNLKVDLYKNKQICIPNIELQNKFADFVQQIDKSKYIESLENKHNKKTYYNLFSNIYYVIL